jgi:hypothetical protein
MLHILATSRPVLHISHTHLTRLTDVPLLQKQQQVNDVGSDSISLVAFGNLKVDIRMDHIVDGVKVARFDKYVYDAGNERWTLRGRGGNGDKGAISVGTHVQLRVARVDKQHDATGA